MPKFENQKIYSTGKETVSEGVSLPEPQIENIKMEPPLKRKEGKEFHRVSLIDSREFIDRIIYSKGNLDFDDDSFPVFSFALEFIEKAKLICRQYDLIFHSKVLDQIKEEMQNVKTGSIQLSFLQIAVLVFMDDLLALDERGDLEDETYSSLMEYFYEVKDSLKEYFE